MPAVKHKADVMNGQSSRSPSMPMFEVFRDELDEHHDRRERIIKASRDVTALSKKMIFSLQRLTQQQGEVMASVKKENTARQRSINELFSSISPDMQGLNAWRYQRQVSPGIQEHMEAISFDYYLQSQSLITMGDAQMKLPAGIMLTGDDYVLGLFDLVGELMRFAITSMAMNGKLPSGGSSSTSEGETAGQPGANRDILMDLRSLRTHFETLDTTSSTATGSTLGRDVEKKMEVMKTCVEKVENSMYGMIIRGRERPKGWVPDVISEDRGREAVESF